MENARIIGQIGRRRERPGPEPCHDRNVSGVLINREKEDGSRIVEDCLAVGSWIGPWPRLRSARVCRSGTPGKLSRPSRRKSRACEEASRRGPNDQIVMGAIGVGGQGTGIMKWAKRKPGVKFVAVCDVDAEPPQEGRRGDRQGLSSVCAIFASCLPMRSLTR